MQGSVDLFISTYNNYFLRFPKLKQVSEYRKKAVEILINLKKYIEKVEGEFLSLVKQLTSTDETIMASLNGLIGMMEGK